MLTAIIIFLTILSVSSSELISLTSKDHILCLTDNFISPLYMDPPHVEDAKNTSILIENDELWTEDWVLVNSKDVNVAPVEDRRWEDFATLYTDHQHFDKLIKLSFSVTTGTGLHITVSDPDLLPPTTKIRDFATWYLNTLNSVKFTPILVDITSEKTNYWKIHDYKLRWSQNASSTPTKITIPEISCLMFYAYAGSNCSMQLDTKNQKYVLEGGKDGRWGLSKITDDSPITITITRKTSNGGSEGFWEIDIRECPKQIANLSVFERKLSDGIITRTCDIVDVSKFKPSSNILTCDPGKLGEDCSLTCEDVLGPDLKYCEQHRICQVAFTDYKYDCYCSWGFQGQACNETCSGGHWGLGCQKICDGCDSCNSKTGVCNAASSFIAGNGIFLLIITFVINQLSRL